MRAIIQRVTKASVTVGEELISSIGKGLCVLIGISRDDTQKDIEYIVRKILNLRLFDDATARRWRKSVKDEELEILCVSQFTLYSVLKGNKPDFHCAMESEKSQTFYEDFLRQLRNSHKTELIKDGKFGEHMQVNIQNDGPVTISLESPDSKQGKTSADVKKGPVKISLESPDSKQGKTSADVKKGPVTISLESPDSKQCKTSADVKNEPVTITISLGSPDSKQGKTSADVKKGPVTISLESPDSKQGKTSADVKNGPVTISLESPDSKQGKTSEDVKKET